MKKQHFTLAAVKVMFAVDSVAQMPAEVNVVINADDNGPITMARMNGLADSAVQVLSRMVQMDVQVGGTTITNLMYLGEMTMEEFLGHPVATDITDITGQFN